MGSSPAGASSRLSIAVVGAGAIGSTFAYYLARAGHSVTAVARPASLRLQQLERDQAIVLTTGETAGVHVADALDDQVAYDLVIVTVLAHQVDALLPSLKASHARCVQFMFNTFEPERLQAEVGAARCSLGMPFVMSRLDEQGRLKATVSASRKTLHGQPRWAEVFNAAGIASIAEPDMALWLRCHVPVCIAMESIASTAHARGGGASWAESRYVARGLHAGFAIVKELGYPLYPKSKKRMDRAPDAALAGMFWFLSRNKTFRELLATGARECRALIEVLTAASSKASAISRATVDSVLALRPASESPNSR